MNKIKSILLLSLAGLFATQPLSGFTIINQTDSKRVLVIQEAYRPDSDLQRKLLCTPEPLHPNKHKVTVPPRSFVEMDIDPCPVLMISTKKKSSKKKRFGGSKTSKSSSTFCFERYEVRDGAVHSFDNDWGLVLFEGPTGRLEAKTVRPELVDQIDPDGELPDELKERRFSRAPLEVRHFPPKS